MTAELGDARPANSRLPMALLVASTVGSSWLLMQVIHECGHVIGALSTGGTIRRVVLVPWEFSRTDLIQNPHPLFVTWAGPIFGVVFPAIVWAIAQRMGVRCSFARKMGLTPSGQSSVEARTPFRGLSHFLCEAAVQCTFWLRFLAGFCGVANGAYIGAGAFTGVGDAGDLLREGSPGWTLIAFGLPTMIMGLMIWNGQGPQFEIGKNAVRVTWRKACASCLVLILILLVELIGHSFVSVLK